MKNAIRLRKIRATQEVAPKQESYAPSSDPKTDAAGRLWDAERYRTNEDGSPLLTSAGNFWLKPGKSHA